MIDVVVEDCSNSVAQKNDGYNWAMTDFRQNKDFNRTLSVCIHNSRLIFPS